MYIQNPKNFVNVEINQRTYEIYYTENPEVSAEAGIQMERHIRPALYRNALFNKPIAIPQFRILFLPRENVCKFYEESFI